MVRNELWIYISLEAAGFVDAASKEGINEGMDRGIDWGFLKGMCSLGLCSAERCGSFNPYFPALQHP